MQDAYDIIEHRHRFSLWAAARAYSRHGPGHTMVTATKLIEQSGLSSIKTPDDLPTADKIDQFLDELIRRVRGVAKGLTYQHKFEDSKSGKKLVEKRPLVCTYGRAQKLVNIYLKSKLVCAGWETHPSVAVLHPPLDGALLKAMRSHTWGERSNNPAARKAFEVAQRLGDTWTNFDKDTYDAYIKAVKLLQGNRPLWAVEWLWRPAQES